ncbi:MAG: uncharacterized protein JWP33_2975, partial [Blastococcus sp.]|nr:uncharacterized protein [Blastococcus sp.]
MSTRSGTATGDGGSAPVNRRRLVIAAVAAVLVGGLVALAPLWGGDDAPSPRAAVVTTAPAPDTSVPPSPPTPTPTGPTEQVDQLPEARPEVPLDQPAEVGNGVTASLPAIEGIQGTGSGPGNIAGPAVRVTVRLVNGTDAPVSVSGVAVNMYHGGDRTPASPLNDPSQRPFAGMVEPQGSAEGVYVFSVPAEA